VVRRFPTLSSLADRYDDADVPDEVKAGLLQDVLEERRQGRISRRVWQFFVGEPDDLPAGD
jgi:hypothetical protein